MTPKYRRGLAWLALAMLLELIALAFHEAGLQPLDMVLAVIGVLFLFPFVANILDSD